MLGQATRAAAEEAEAAEAEVGEVSEAGTDEAGGGEEIAVAASLDTLVGGSTAAAPRRSSTASARRSSVASRRRGSIASESSEEFSDGFSDEGEGGDAGQPRRSSTLDRYISSSLSSSFKEDRRSSAHAPAPLAAQISERLSGSGSGAAHAAATQAVLERIVATLHEMPVFASLRSEELVRMCEGSAYHVYARHHVVYREGTQAGWMCVLLAGAVGVVDFRGHTELLQRTRGEFWAPAFGEEGCSATQLPRFTTATAASDGCALMIIPRSVLPEKVLAAIHRAVIARLLRQVRSLFATDDDAMLATVAPLFVFQHAARGEAIMRQWEAADALFLVVIGKLRVTVYGTWAQPVEVGVIRASARAPFFGESSILDTEGGRRNATVTALEPCWLLRLDKRNFARFVSYVPDIRGRFREIQRLVEMGNRAKRHKADQAKLRAVLEWVEHASDRAAAGPPAPAASGSFRKPRGSLIKNKLIEVLERKRDVERTAGQDLALRASSVLDAPREVAPIELHHLSEAPRGKQPDAEYSPRFTGASVVRIAPGMTGRASLHERAVARSKPMSRKASVARLPAEAARAGGGHLASTMPARLPAGGAASGGRATGLI